MDFLTDLYHSICSEEIAVPQDDFVGALDQYRWIEILRKPNLDLSLLLPKMKPKDELLSVKSNPITDSVNLVWPAALSCSAVALETATVRIIYLFKKKNYL